MMLRSQLKNSDALQDARHKRKQNEQKDGLKSSSEPLAKKPSSNGLTELRTHISGFQIDSAKRTSHDVENQSPPSTGGHIKKLSSTSDPCPHFDYDLEESANPESVSEYAADIFQYYKSREVHFKVDGYLHKHAELDVKTRAILIDWLVEIQETFELNHETLYNAVRLTDLFLSKTDRAIDRSAVQKLACVAVFLAAKYDERSPPLVDDLIYLSGDRFTREDLLSMERELFDTIGFDLGAPLSYRYLRRLGRVCRVDMRALTLARYLLETSLLVYDYSLVSQSRMAAAAFLMAMRMLDANYEWSPVLVKYSGYTGEEILPLVDHLNHTMHFVTETWTQLKSIRQKYSHEVFFSVANIPFLPDISYASLEIAPLPIMEYP